jgi:NADH:ubiquinone oxidoreductase subunit 2 (subunit N)
VWILSSTGKFFARAASAIKLSFYPYHFWISDLRF